ncbi:hypothetical protein DOE76_06315 [Leifsonia sp. ku-ls]|nr:hypothetical protein DOE76_06315 [Leifsonia sp. ku-ls]
MAHRRIWTRSIAMRYLAAVWAVVLALVAPSVALPSTAAAAPEASAECATPLLSEQKRAEDVAESDPATFLQAAAINGRSESDFRSLAEDETFWLDRCGQAYYSEERHPLDAPRVDARDAGVPVAPLSQTLELQSKPDSPLTIYLDFLGGEVSGTGWNERYTYNGVKYPTFYNEPYSLDGKVDTDFSDAELLSIQRVWQSVAEDYAPFDVNVTTKDLGLDAIDRSSASDPAYGVRVMVTRTNPYGDTCGCGGAAYVNAFSFVANHMFYNPAWVFTDGAGRDSKGIAEAAAHEAGHTFGLQHHGTSTDGYYEGVRPWAPIMGAGYYQPVTQWSHGEYPGANNSGQDDVAVIARVAPLRTDDHGDSAAAGTLLSAGTPLAGLIESRSDVDAFRFTAAGPTTVTVSTGPFSDLNSQLTILDSSGATVAVVNDPVTVGVPSYEVAVGLNSVWNAALPPEGGEYVALVTGVGTGDPRTAGQFSDYGSLGRYQIALTTTVPLTLTAGAPAAGTVNSAYAGAFVSAAGGAAPYTYAATGLPDGLGINAATGAITGTPTTAGTYSVTITVTDANAGTASQTVTVSIAEPVALTVGTPAVGTVNTAYENAFVTATGGVGPYTYSAAGLPAGLVMAAGTGTVTGTPAGIGTFAVSVTVTDAEGRTDKAVVDLRVLPQPLLVSAGTPATGTVGSAYDSTFVLAGGGVAPYSYAATGLPDGLTIDAATGAVTGTPTVAGTSTVTLTVTDAEGTTGSQTTTITVRGALTLTAARPDPATVGTPYASTFVAVGGGVGPYSFVAAGLPDGTTIDAATGAVTGTPTTAGTFPLTITVTDSEGRGASATAVIAVSDPLVVTTAAPPAGTVGTAFDSTFVAVGGGVGPYAYSATGLPDGLTIDAATGAVTGTPTTAGQSTVTIVATDVDGRTASATVDLVIAEPLVLDLGAPPAGTVDATYDGRFVRAVGGAEPYAFTANGLPAGLAIDAATGAIAGTPTEAGAYAITIAVTDVDGRVDTKTATLTVFTNPPASLVVVHGTAGELPSSVGTARATVGVPYKNATLSASGGTAPYRWSLREGTLPDGLSIHPETGEISGVPSAVGRSVFTVQAADVDGVVGVSEIFSITVSRATVPVLPPSGGWTEGGMVGAPIPSLAGPEPVTTTAQRLAQTGAGASPAGALLAAVLFVSGVAAVVARRWRRRRALT